MSNSTATMTAEAFIASCRANGVTIERCDNVLTLSKKFTVNDTNGFAEAESAVSVIYEAPQGTGSTWGTDGASIGGMVALRSTGVMRMNRSGVKKNWLKALQKAMK